MGTCSTSFRREHVMFVIRDEKKERYLQYVFVKGMLKSSQEANRSVQKIQYTMQPLFVKKHKFAVHDVNYFVL